MGTFIFWCLIIWHALLGIGSLLLGGGIATVAVLIAMEVWFNPIGLLLVVIVPALSVVFGLSGFIYEMDRIAEINRQRSFFWLW